MSHIRWIASILLLAALAVGCERKEGRVTAPAPPEKPETVEAHWVWDQELEAAVQGAAASPLVQRAIAEVPNPRLTPRWDLAVRAIGTMSDGSHVGVTILPYVVDQDLTHALFISYLEGDGRRLAEPSELILGREPTSLETGFQAIRIGDRVGWIKGGQVYKWGAASGIQPVVEKPKWTNFVDCLMQGAEQGCATGAAIAQSVAPGVPRASAIGCAAGVAVVAVGCAIEHLL